jgi:hypothetical protein
LRFSHDQCQRWHAATRLRSARRWSARTGPWRPGFPVRVVRPGSKIEACDQVEQALIGTIRDRDRQRFLVKSFDIAADDVSQQPTQGPLLGRACRSKLRVFAGRCGRSASRDAAAKATRTSRSCQPLQIIEEAPDLYSRPRLRFTVNFASSAARAAIRTHPKQS